MMSEGSGDLLGERSQAEGGRAPPSPSVARAGRDGRGRAPPKPSDAAAAKEPAAPGGGVGGGTGGGALAGGKKRHRRRPSKKKRRWKPYFKLSWEEKKKLDERESVRAAKTRAEMFAKGFTVAPYNTTQFLMEEHNQEEPDLNPGGAGGGGGAGAGGPPRRAVKSDETSEEDELLLLDEEEQQDSGSDGMGGDGGGEFLQRDFSETYEKYHAESLQNMTKQELIREYLELEKCLSRLEDENNRLRGRLDGGKAAVIARAGELESSNKLKELEREMERLRAENLQLLKENELYKQEQKLSESVD
ncbi:protein HEXIM1-like [Chiloscyllium plagiosum]|uniref:protein HEXIM1-like n=1 Tax=Chiloscyllium plagiosum TaxID=36176 RepID=UPI001CB7D8F5|nr:protein HEXIM1-like [Chiloscyllium plagiosum]